MGYRSAAGSRARIGLIAFAPCSTPEHVVFSIMAGNRSEDVSGNNLAYVIVSLIAAFSLLASPVLLVGYVGLVVRAWRGRG
jgi:hypothetical protein